MLLKEIGRKIAQVFRLARAADEKVASSIAAALDAKAEQIKEYEKRFEPEHPKPDPLPEVRASLAQVGFSVAAATYAAPEICRKPETRATKPPDKQLAQDARSADASKTCIVQEKKEVPRWAEGHGARRN